MAVVIERRYSEAIHPLHAMLLAGSVPLFLGALLSDLAYFRTYEIQWANFASWLLVGALIFSGLALIFAIVDLCQARQRAAGLIPYAVLVLVAWVVGVFNALMHARDAWAVMPGGLIMSVITTSLVLLAAWLGFCTPRMGGVK